MKEITIKLYQFSELSDSAKEKARQWWRECNDGDSSWGDFTIDECVEQGGLLGITFDERQVRLVGGGTRGKPRIWWSGFYSQGDGACFEGSWSASDVKADKVAEGWGDSPETTEIKRIAAGFAEIARQYPGASFRVKHNGHYYHRFCTTFDVDVGHDWESGVGTQEAENAEASLIELARDFMLWIYQMLEKQCDYINSDEAVDESIEANDYQFYASGERAREE